MKQIEEYIIDNGIKEFIQHDEYIKEWEKAQESFIDKTKNKKLQNFRRNNYEAVLDNYCYIFEFTRIQTRYEQVNYVKHAYKTTYVEHEIKLDLKDLLSINKFLESINYECSLTDYYQKNQRKLMTKELREKIMLRDNYTCQICGKYMPDTVGLQIDHIIPVSKGGKTVESNLQVLCSVCNAKKSNK